MTSCAPMVGYRTKANPTMLIKSGATVRALRVKHGHTSASKGRAVSCRKYAGVVYSSGDTQAEAGFKLGSVQLPAPLGIGCWSWGNTSFWNDSWTEQDAANASEAFSAAMENDLVFFDTAEAYNGPDNAGSMGGFAQGAASSEALLGDMARAAGGAGAGAAPMLCTKFSALPWRLGRGAVVDALKNSLDRLGVDKVSAYMCHWPGLWQNEQYYEGLGDAVEMGLVETVGVSNHNVEQMRRAHGVLAKRGIPLAFNQLQYSMFYNNPERTGMLDAIRELDMVLMAYSPLQSGILTGKYSSTQLPAGPRGQIYAPVLQRMDPLLDLMRDVGAAHGGKTPTQVALNYLICQGNVLPIPGAKSAEQVREFAGAVGWALTAEEVEALRARVMEVRAAVAEASLPARLLDDAMLRAGV